MKLKTLPHLIGNTQLIKLQRLVSANAAELFVKMESANPGGSVKDRIGLAMIEDAERSGLLKSGGTIIEATSGNTGIALALVSAARGYRCILTMPETMSIERRQLLSLYGAQVVLTPGSEGMPGAIKKAHELVAQTPGSFMPKQFENPANPEIHRQTTAEEIWAATNGEIDYFVCAVGTGGTITGVGEVLKQKNPNIQIIAVEPRESPVLSGGKHSPHRIQGIGTGFIPSILNVSILDGVELVSTEEAFALRYKLAIEEGILAGISSGASICAAIRVAERLPASKKVVSIVHDTGERYLSMSA
ncbi:MAG: hypothetical protein RL637_654 [Pseudomonadota bacterium]|jgi:cysteine synthase A